MVMIGHELDYRFVLWLFCLLGTYSKILSLFFVIVFNH